MIRMQQRITPFLWFDTDAEEAMNTYVSIFPDSRIVSIRRYPEGPLEGPMQGMEGKVLTGVFELMGQTFMALDGGPFFPPSGAVSFYIECDTQEEVDAYWDALTEDGDPAAQQCGWLKDRFGFSWQIIPSALPRLMNDSDQQKAARVMQAMLQMKKIEIQALQDAYDGK